MDHQSSAPVLTETAPENGHRTELLGEFTTASAVTSLQPFPPSASSTPEVPSTYLAPTEHFPTALAELELAQLHVLHSRVARQLEREYGTDPTGPHPVTLDRVQELEDELDTREEFLGPPEPALPEVGGTQNRSAARDAATAAADSPATETPAAPSAQPAGSPSTIGRPSPAPPRAHRSLDRLFRRQDRSVGTIGLCIGGLDQLRPGDEIEVWHHEHLQCVAVVEETAPALGVLWVREAVDGYRRMVHTRDTVLRYHLPHDPR